MSQTGSVWMIILAACIAANLPFLNQRILLLGPVLLPHKNLPVRLIELVFFYFLVGAAGLWLENRAGQIASQGWEFYAITGTLFVTLAFPGFVYKYLSSHRH